MPLLKTRDLHEFFPVSFSNGVLVKQFSKSCIACKHNVQAQQMHGIVRTLDDHIAIAATATCPSCRTEFSVCCVIDQQKRVHRVGLPVFLLKLYLRALPLRPAEQEAQARTARIVEKIVESHRQASVAQAADAGQYPRASETLGQYQGKPIPAYIIIDGQNVPFDRVEPAGNVGQGEYLLDGCLVYKAG